MEDIEFSRLLHANLEWSTESGEVFFSLKRKDEWGPTYYIFDMNLEVLPDDQKAKFNEAWDIMKLGAIACGVKLFDTNEIQDAVITRVKEILTSENAEKAMDEADKTGEITLVRDIEISLFDHATGQVTSLEIGISVPPGSAELIKEAMKVDEK